MRDEAVFLKGVATAAHQVEGNNTNSDCWAMEHMKNTSFAEPSGQAVDHYHRFREDIGLLKQAGLNAYRFSLEWARIEPERGSYDGGALQHYREVLECCHENGITPIVTMHHFSSPKWLIERGGWENEETIASFRDYCAFVIRNLGGQMEYVCTINEANMGLQLSSIIKKIMKQMQADVQAGVTIAKNPMAERQKAAAEENIQVFGTPSPQVFLNMRTEEGDRLIFRAHEAAREAMKAIHPELKIGITLSLHDIQAAGGGEEQAQKAWEEEFSHYLPYLREDDFIGVQNYTRQVFGKDGVCPVPQNAKRTQMDYEYYPDGLEHVIRKVYSELPLPVLVTENGIATADDEERCAFIDSALKGVSRCLSDSIPVKGYLYWSLLDNFEWQKGFGPTFGLVEVDRATMERKPKKSLKYLGET